MLMKAFILVCHNMFDYLGFINYVDYYKGKEYIYKLGVTSYILLCDVSQAKPPLLSSNLQ